MESPVKNGRAAGRRRKSGTAPIDEPHALTPSMRIALSLLLDAHQTAARLYRDPWDFALEIHALKEAGVTHNDLRSLVCQRLTEHRLERTRRGSSHRAFGPPRSFRLHTDSCFAISEAGLRVAQRVTAPARPSWDAARRELRLGSLVVKRFRQPAFNQETILAAFEEDGWPPRIDNPLPGNGDTEAVDRLHEAVKKLNRGPSRRLRFLSDGAGLGILWELASDLGAT